MVAKGMFYTYISSCDAKLLIHCPQKQMTVSDEFLSKQNGQFMRWINFKNTINLKALQSFSPQFEISYLTG